MKGIDSVYGSSNGSIILDNVVCDGIEENLLMCAHAGILNSNCDHSQDAAVKCGGKSRHYVIVLLCECFLFLQLLASTAQ